MQYTCIMCCTNLKQGSVVARRHFALAGSLLTATYSLSPTSFLDGELQTEKDSLDNILTRTEHLAEVFYLVSAYQR